MGGAPDYRVCGMRAKDGSRRTEHASSRSGAGKKGLLPVNALASGGVGAWPQRGCRSDIPRTPSTMARSGWGETGRSLQLGTTSQLRTRTRLPIAATAIIRAAIGATAGPATPMARKTFSGPLAGLRGRPRRVVPAGAGDEVLDAGLTARPGGGGVVGGVVGIGGGSEDAPYACLQVAEGSQEDPHAISLFASLFEE